MQHPWLNRIKLGCFQMAFMTMVCMTVVRPEVCRAQETVYKLADIRQAVDRQGKLLDPKLRQQTGWRVMHGFQWAIELRNERGDFQAARPTDSFHDGQYFRIRIETASDLYVYVLVANADGTKVVLLPAEDEPPCLVKRGESCFLPSTGTFKFSDPPGKETLRLVVCPTALPWATPEELWQIQEGHMLNPDDLQALESLKSVKSISSKSVGKKATPLRKFQSIAKAVGDGARDFNVVGVETGKQDVVVVFGTPTEGSAPIILHDIVLKHDK